MFCVKNNLFFLQVEFIIMGGTFMSLPDDYRDYFVRNLHDAISGNKSNNIKEVFVFMFIIIIIEIEFRPYSIVNEAKLNALE